ncbi:hypothetical protein CRUP_019273, partial [Coryphaenoides rupestris]
QGRTERGGGDLDPQAPPSGSRRRRGSHVDRWSPIGCELLPLLALQVLQGAEVPVAVHQQVLRPWHHNANNKNNICVLVGLVLGQQQGVGAQAVAGGQGRAQGARDSSPPHQSATYPRSSSLSSRCTQSSVPPVTFNFLREGRNEGRKEQGTRTHGVSRADAQLRQRGILSKRKRKMHALK